MKIIHVLISSSEHRGHALLPNVTDVRNVINHSLKNKVQAYLVLYGDVDSKIPERRTSYKI